uniref:Carboxypeptidase n=1 Tax=Meloidogyne javanica TaxID=6303 RepID=A0A915LRJ8_MELJA
MNLLKEYRHEKDKRWMSNNYVLWLNGGPGCSSLLGLFTELGPYLLSDDGTKLIKNPYAWNNKANVLFLESPAGVGYSYSTDGNLTTNDDETANYNYEALKQFYSKFPDFKGRPTIISGESYAGVYLPMLANLIINGQKNYPINFKGVLIGNGYLSRTLNINTMLSYARGHGFVDEGLWQSYSKECCNGCIDTCDIWAYVINRNTTCYNHTVAIFNQFSDCISNAYNIYLNCGVSTKSSQSLAKNKLLRLFSRTPFMLKTLGSLLLEENKFENLKTQSKGESYDPSIIPCVDDNILTNYMNLPKVRETLNIPKSLNNTWYECSDFNYDDQYDDMLDFMKNIIKAKVPVMAYYGDTDIVCNLLLGERFATQLGIKLLTPKTSWIFEKQIGGTVTEYEGFTLLTVRGVGHMVPEWAPERALYILTQFLNQTST